jgi:RNA polymerase sigma-70 factor (ECF subfamily)
MVRAELIEGAQTPAKAGSTLHELYLERIHAFVSRRIPNTQDAEDVTCEVFAAAYQNLGKAHGEPLLWLYGIARRKVADATRRSVREQRPEALPSSLCDDPHARLEEVERLMAVRELVNNLPSDQREALLLQELEELAVEEIATVMKRSGKSVKALLQRARENLRRNGAHLIEDL